MTTPLENNEIKANGDNPQANNVPMQKKPGTLSGRRMFRSKTTHYATDTNKANEVATTTIPTELDPNLATENGKAEVPFTVEKKEKGLPPRSRTFSVSEKTNNFLRSLTAGGKKSSKDETSTVGTPPTTPRKPRNSIFRTLSQGSWKKQNSVDNFVTPSFVLPTPVVAIDGEKQARLLTVMRAFDTYCDETIVNTEGFFRQAGLEEDVRFLMKNFNAGNDVGFEDVNVHTVHSVVKRLMRQVVRFDTPQPNLDVKASDITDATDNIEAIASQKRANVLEWYQQLNGTAREVLDIFLSVCLRVERNRDINKMKIDAIATVVAPAVCSMFNIVNGDAILEQQQQLFVMTTLLKNYITTYTPAITTTTTTTTSAEEGEENTTL